MDFKKGFSVIVGCGKNKHFMPSLSTILLFRSVAKEKKYPNLEFPLKSKDRAQGSKPISTQFGRDAGSW